MASRNYRRARRQGFLAGGLALLLLLLLAAQVGVWTMLRRQEAAVALRLRPMERELARHQEDIQKIRAGLAGDAVTAYEAKVGALNAILEAAAFSWSGLLTELERSVPPGVTLAEIAPDTRSGRVALRGSARSFTELRQFLRSLEQRPAFGDVFLLRQAARRSSSAGPEVLDYSIVLTYRGRDA